MRFREKDHAADASFASLLGFVLIITALVLPQRKSVQAINAISSGVSNLIETLVRQR